MFGQFIKLLATCGMNSLLLKHGSSQSQLYPIIINEKNIHRRVHHLLPVDMICFSNRRRLILFPVFIKTDSFAYRKQR